MKKERILRSEKKKLIHSFILENRQWFILLGAISLFLILMMVVVWYSGTQKKLEPGAETFHYVMGVKVPYSENMKLVHTEKGTVIEDNDAVYSDGTPIVNEEEAQLILPVSMGLMRPFHEDSLKRVNYFATLKKAGNITEINQNGFITNVEEGFLYDGSGTYIFLEDMTLSIGSSTYYAHALTYAKVFYKDAIEIYNITTGDYQYIDISNADTTALSADGYSINLGTGVMTIGNTERILFADIDAMGVLK